MEQEGKERIKRESPSRVLAQGADKWKLSIWRESFPLGSEKENCKQIYTK